MPVPISEVMNALVQAMKGGTDYRQLNEDELVALGNAGRQGRQTLHEVVVELRNRGCTFAHIAELFGVSESTASRWVDPPQPPGRRPRGGAHE